MYANFEIQRLKYKLMRIKNKIRQKKLVLSIVAAHLCLNHDKKLNRFMLILLNMCEDFSCYVSIIYRSKL